ncbi:FKBP-type peptidyl-prolyl cis-trans isomerase [Ferruginibacter paludis]|uniref:FKBP-type peptidyl-prolyl cis-trans isomerase n=1 Tax=Ferruginibacter paludis TaxID=1310417 RepID=UPI0025B3DF4B|nr:FKBP-type peptidyl-prolyl cis-trans isomerase [Ferruginibacter paludis]MDN3657870.1 FKBP-type peptidyl-prolyl cis-trans isomerase [Ferruginibacter paludis]
MKQFFLVACVVTITGMQVSAQSKPKTTTAAKPAAGAVKPAVSALKSSTDSFSYALGMNVANNLKQQGIDQITYAAMEKAMEDVFKKRTAALNDQQANMCIQQKLQTNAAKKSGAEKAKATAFLEANKKRTGVITLPSGLQYEVLKKGDATSATPKAVDTVVANYAGTLIDGKEFDNSYKRGEPLTIPVGGVIRGWTEILQLMHIGDKFKVFIPSELGYGERGAGADIPGGAALIFEMELLGIKPNAPATTGELKPIGADTTKPQN